LTYRDLENDRLQKRVTTLESELEKAKAEIEKLRDDMNEWLSEHCEEYEHKPNVKMAEVLLAEAKKP